MAHGRRILGQLVLVLAVTAGAFVGSKLGMLGTREVGASHNFSDVPDSAFYHAFVEFLVDNGITSGCGGGRFCGEESVTRGQMAVFLQRLAALTCLRREGNDVIFEGCNIHIRSGAGATEAAVNGLGNLIIGYNEESPPGGSENRTGSHNLVVGSGHTYSSYGGIVAGDNNVISGQDASVTGGSQNVASGSRSSISGGQFNSATSAFASVSGGRINLANGQWASVSGGDGNSASGSSSSVSGGQFRSAVNVSDWRAGNLVQDF